jgi:hypothetical protein
MKRWKELCLRVWNWCLGKSGTTVHASVEREKSPRKYSSQKLVTHLRTHYDFRYNYKTTQKKNKQKGTLPKESPSFIDTLKIIPSLEH